VRYTAEIGGKDPAAKALVAQAKRIQDAIGEWRDWDNLTKTAARELEDVHSPALISFLNNVTGAKLSIATRAVVEVTNRLLSTAPAKKMPESVKNRQSRRRASLQA
jgi:CHAD domain-containing protein